MLIKKGKYGLKAMVHLASVPDGHLVSAGEIAQRHQIPRKFLDNIFIELRNAGFVLSRKGKGAAFVWHDQPMISLLATSSVLLMVHWHLSPAPAKRTTTLVKTATKPNAKCAT